MTWDLGDLVSPLKKLSSTKKICWFGDPCGCLHQKYGNSEFPEETWEVTGHNITTFIQWYFRGKFSLKQINYPYLQFQSALVRRLLMTFCLLVFVMRSTRLSLRYWSLNSCLCSVKLLANNNMFLCLDDKLLI